MRIYATQVSNLTDARYFAAWGVDYLGFDCQPSSATYLPLEKSRAIREWLDGVKIVAEFGEQSPPDVLFHLSELKPEGLTIPANLPAGSFELLNDQASELFVRIDATQARDWSVDLEAPRYREGTFILQGSTDTPTSLLRDLAKEYRLLLDLPLPATQLLRLCDEVQPYGLVVRGGDEEKVGYKSFDELDELFEVLEARNFAE